MAAPSSSATHALDASAAAMVSGEGLMLPVSADPAAFASAHFHGYTGDTTGDAHGLQFTKGTTTLAFRYQGGVIVSVDSRSTQGSYIGAPCGGGRLFGVWVVIEARAAHRSPRSPSSTA